MMMMKSAVSSDEAGSSEVATNKAMSQPKKKWVPKKHNKAAAA